MAGAAAVMGTDHDEVGRLLLGESVQAGADGARVDEHADAAERGGHVDDAARGGHCLVVTGVGDAFGSVVACHDAGGDEFRRRRGERARERARVKPSVCAVDGDDDLAEHVDPFGER